MDITIANILMILSSVLIIVLIVVFCVIIDLILTFNSVIKRLKELVEKGNHLLDKVDNRTITIITTLFKIFKK